MDSPPRHPGLLREEVEEMKRTFQFPKKYWDYGIWRMYLMQNIWRQMDHASREYIRDWINGHP